MKNFIKENPEAVRNGLVEIFETPEGREMIRKLLADQSQEYIDSTLDYLYGSTGCIESWMSNLQGEGPGLFGRVLCATDRCDLETMREDLIEPNMSDVIFDVCEQHTPERVEEQITRWRSHREASYKCKPSL